MSWDLTCTDVSACALRAAWAMGTALCMRSCLLAACICSALLYDCTKHIPASHHSLLLLPHHATPRHPLQSDSQLDASGSAAAARNARARRRSMFDCLLQAERQQAAAARYLHARTPPRAAAFATPAAGAITAAFGVARRVPSVTMPSAAALGARPAGGGGGGGGGGSGLPSPLYGRPAGGGGGGGGGRLSATGMMAAVQHAGGPPSAGLGGRPSAGQRSAGIPRVALLGLAAGSSAVPSAAEAAAPGMGAGGGGGGDGGTEAAHRALADEIEGMITRLQVRESDGEVERDRAPAG